MTRLFFWLLLAFLAATVLRRLSAGTARSPRRGADAAPVAEEMVRCRACGLNLPQSEAIAVAGGWACCAEHAHQP